MDLYELLNIDEFSSQIEIKQKYRELCLKYHPDKCHDDGEYFKRIQSAYEILSNPEMRTKYNMRRRVIHINIIELTDPEYELLYIYYCKLRETNEYKLMNLLYNSFPRQLKEIIKQKIKITKHAKINEIYHAPKWIDITELSYNQIINLYVSMVDAYKGIMKTIFIKTIFGTYYLFLRDFNTSFEIYNGSCNLTICMFTKNWGRFYRKNDDLYCLVKEDDVLIELPDNTHIINTKSTIDNKGFYNKGNYGNLVFVTYF
tara:strand:+ start:5100 stop:5873 length:774 start_codon:yes stop_codon:yes gene_type:complete